MKHFALTLLLPILCLAPLGCQSDNPDNGTTPPSITTITPEQIAKDIQDGTSLAVTIGLPFFPDQVTTKADAAKALIAVNAVLAILKDDAAGTAGAQDLLKQILSGNLTSFADCPIMQTILQAGLPLLTENLPKGVDAASVLVNNKIPQPILSYIVAFFTGAQQGLNNYLGVTKAIAKAVTPDTITAGAGTIKVSDLQDAVAKLSKSQTKAMKK